MTQTPKIDAFTRGFLEAALWTNDPWPESGEWSESDRWNIDAIHPDSLARAIAVCADFQEAQADDLALTGASDERNGVDFWLTSNGHGTGFWDRGYGPVGDRLSEAARAYGPNDVMGPELNDQGSAVDDGSGWDGVIYLLAGL